MVTGVALARSSPGSCGRRRYGGNVQASGVVLAGGASRRMGRDKALLVVDGERLIDRSVRVLRSVVDDVVVASGRRTIRGLPVPQVPDQRGGAGPLSGLAAGLLQAEHDIAAVLAVDLPDADAGLLRGLIERWDGEGALIPSAGGRPQPLHAVWATTNAVSLSVLIADGVRSVMGAATVLDARVLSEEETRELVDHDRWARNVNTPADL